LENGFVFNIPSEEDGNLSDNNISVHPPHPEAQPEPGMLFRIAKRHCL
jgi:hypothetical protein